MQPEPPSTSQNAVQESSTSPDDIPTQHGLRALDESVALSSANNVGATTTSAEQLALDAVFAASLQKAGESRPTPTDRLSPRKTPSPPARNRIAEYEQASTPPIRKREGPGFEVIKSHRSPGDKRSPIQDLPNEVLTHSLALLAPTDLASVSLVSKRFHDLVTGPHAWRSAFAHFFPGSESINLDIDEDEDSAQGIVLSAKRNFTRLTALASWRSEYIIRTRLLRSLARGKPVQPPTSSNASRLGNVAPAHPVMMYNSQLWTTINHLHATYGNVNAKRTTRFVHGADDVGAATSSDPTTLKIDNWGLSDPQSFQHFVDRFPGNAEYGLGPGEIVGVPNTMDVSQPFGMIYGEGLPGGMVYFRSTEEMRGRFLQFSSAMSMPKVGIPRIASSTESTTAVWIAKSLSVPSLTDGLIGLLSGSSLGVLTAYSLGSTGSGKHRNQRFGRGEMTARWALSPGVPIVAIAVDNEYNLSRYNQNRIWAVVLNALGEVFYLTKFPKRPHADRGPRLDEELLERNAWLTGRSVYWNIVEPSRRVAKVDPYAQGTIDGSYSPRSSWNGMCLSSDQIEAETKEIEAFARRQPKEFQKLCIGWDMRRKIEVDFAGDDGNYAGENVIVFECGLEEGSVAAITRYGRCKVYETVTREGPRTPSLTSGSTDPPSPPSIFGTPASPMMIPAPNLTFERLESSLAQDDFGGSITPRPMAEEWRTTTFAFNGMKNVQIMATTIDSSVIATQTASEDPLLSFSGRSTTSSPSLTPGSPTVPVANSADIPGQRSRLFAVGTMLGAVLLWNARAPTARSADVTNQIDPVRIIYTDSPQISCLGLSSLYLVHGGNDGLVQAWDPLASNMQPIRTLHSRFSSRARRRLVQAQASPQGVGINLFAAGAISLDPDPTILRGMVSLGTHLRFWTYSSSAADQYKSHKRRLHRSERGSNNAGGFSGGVRSNLKDYIANERQELDREIVHRKKEAHRFAGRFGTELLDGSEEEMMAYAAMLSQEAFEQDNKRRPSDTSTTNSTAVSSMDHGVAATPDAMQAQNSSPRRSTPKTNDELEADIAEAIRQSLSMSSGSYDIPIRQAKSKVRKGSSAKASPTPSPYLAGSSHAAEMSDLEFALQLSLAEEQSKQAAESDEFPSISSGQVVTGKGKGRAG